MFHKVFDGNVNGARTLQDLISLFGTYKLNAGGSFTTVVIVSGRNLKEIKRFHCDTLCGVAACRSIPP